MKIERLLFPTKFSELDFNSLESLLVLKNVGLREVILYYVIPREEVGFVPYGGYLKEEEEKIREEARIRFEDWQKAFADKGINSKIIIEVGEPVPNILKIAEKERVNLIVVGKKKKLGHEGHFIGSHTLQIITRSKIPTLVSKYMVQFEREGEIVTQINKDVFKRPLLAADWSWPSEKALDLLVSLNGLIEKAFVCHVIGVKIAKSIDKTELHRLEKESKERLEKYCERLKSAGVAAEPHLGAGRTIMEIIRISRDVKASMIIMGTTGKDRMHEFFLGSVSHRISAMSELPTLLVP
ncbi:MAG: universal stress protein [Nitrospirae bacterium]|nr:universal stress protein [Nitrospirota bacterium]